MKKCSLILAAMACLVLIGARGAAAQGFTFNPYAGVLIADDGGLEDAVAGEDLTLSIDPALIAGLRLGMASRSNVGFEAGYGYSPLNIEISEGGVSLDVDATAHLYYAALVYTLTRTDAVSFFLSGGAGGITISGDEDFFDGAENSSTDLMVNVGGGLLWQASDRFAVRLDAKDHIGFCSASDDEDDFTMCPLDDKALNHIELSGGITLQLGG